MSDPFKHYKDPLRGAIQELVSAESALNMPPSPKNPVPMGAEYLSQRDEWAEHAMLHLQEVFTLLQQVETRANWQDSLQRFLGTALEKKQADGTVNLSSPIVQQLESLLQRLYPEEGR